MNDKELPKIQLEIIAEIQRSLDLLGANSGLMTCVGSWGDTLPQKDILLLIKDWNNQAEKNDWIKQKAIFN